MLFSMFISLFTSRIILEVLGVGDYGVYNVVGGVVGLFSFLNGAMSGATSRFITYELGTGNKEKLPKIFNSAITVHLFIGLLVVILAETVGLWFMNTKLVIEPASRVAAHWVFQLSILTTVVSLVQVPYNAVLLAHEKMSVFAYFNITISILRLLIVYLLLIIPGPKLIFYAVLMLLISVGANLTYSTYCKRHYDYTRVSFKLVDYKTVKPMLTFSGLDMFGNLSVLGRTQGINMLANMFFGTVANASIGIATQVQGAVNSFATNITMAIKPQIIKSYASGDYNYMQQLMFRGSKFAFLVVFILGLPIIIETPFLLKIWLKEVPEYTVWICRWTLCFSLFSNISFVLVTGVHATGDIRGPSLVNGAIYISVVPLTYVTYKLGMSIYVPFVLNALFVFIGAMANFLYTKKYVSSLSFSKFLIQVILRCLGVATISAVIPVTVYYFIHDEWLQAISVGITSLICSCLFSYYFALSKTERIFVLNALKKVFSKLKFRKVAA